jgi:methylated-DNA-[protein]-cysteine S-methyltransferase
MPILNLAEVTGVVSYSYLPTPLGPALVVSAADALIGLYLSDHGTTPVPGPEWRRDEVPFVTVRAQLDEYFAGRRTTFDLALAPHGTPFQRAVWSALSTIPYATTVGYGTLAAAIGRPSASRAVGAANGANPISIIIPCHRVIGADGSLTGYGWGVEQKAWLLAHELAR